MKHMENVVGMNHGFFELVVILFTLNTRCDYVISYFNYRLIEIDCKQIYIEKSRYRIAY